MNGFFALDLLLLDGTLSEPYDDDDDAPPPPPPNPIDDWAIYTRELVNDMIENI